MSGLDEYRDRAALLHAFGKKARGHALAQPAAHRVAHRSDREMHLAGMHLRRGSDGIKPRLEPSEREDQLLDRRLRGWKREQQIEQVGVGGLGARIALGERLQAVGLAGIACAGSEHFDGLIGRPADVARLDQCLA